jgi:hypothetical protein
VLAEFGPAAEIISIGRDGRTRWSLDDLLPHRFSLTPRDSAGEG